jgi:predicted Zn-dependent protease
MMLAENAPAMKPPLTLLLVLLLFPAAIVAAPTPTKPAAAGSAALEQAADLAAKGNVAAAIARLERDRATLGPRALSLLGTLYVQANRPADALAVLKPLADAADAEAAVLYNAGHAAVLAGQAKLGSAYLARSVDKDPSSPAARELGVLLSRSGRVVEAYGLLRPWVLRHPADGDARLIAAGLALELERPAETQQMLAGMVESPAVRLLQARALVQQGKGADALRLVQPLLTNHPPAVDLEVRRTAAAAYLSAGQPAKAVEVLAGRAGKVPELVLLLGRAQRQLGNAAAAMATLAPLASQLPDDPKTIGDPRPAAAIAVEYGELLLAVRKTAEGTAFLQRATRLHPQSRQAWDALARALHAAGKTGEAARAKQEADRLAAAGRPRGAPPAAAAAAAGAAPRPSSTAAAAPPAAAAPSAAAGQPGRAASPPKPEWAQRATALLDQQKPQEAVAVLRAHLGTNPRDKLAHTMLIQVLLGTRQFPAAIEAAKKAVAVDGKDANLVYQLGAAEMGANDLVSAERDFRKALSLQPEHTAAMNDLAVLLMSTGKRDEARRLLEQVLRLHPDDRTAKANLEQLRKEGTTGR